MKKYPSTQGLLENFGGGEPFFCPIRYSSGIGMEKRGTPVPTIDYRTRASE
jgi:hypothetical protein